LSAERTPTSGISPSRISTETGSTADLSNTRISTYSISTYSISTHGIFTCSISTCSITTLCFDPNLFLGILNLSALSILTPGPFVWAHRPSNNSLSTFGISTMCPRTLGVSTTGISTSNRKLL
jgi:hypothetical protein